MIPDVLGCAGVGALSRFSSEPGWDGELAFRRRTKSLSAGLVRGHELGEVWWLAGSQNLVRDERDLVLDSLLDGKPVQLLEYGCYVVAEVRTRHGSSE